jgi:hypothetical protein
MINRTRGEDTREKKRCEARVLKDMRQREKLQEQQLKITELRKELIFLHQKCASEVTPASEQAAAAAADDADERSRAQEAMSLTIFHRLKWCLPGCGKWKNIAYELFSMKVLKKEVIRQSVKHISTNVYSKMTLAEAADRVPGVSLRAIEGFLYIQNAKKVSKRMIWSSGSVKKNTKANRNRNFRAYLDGRH